MQVRCPFCSETGDESMLTEHADHAPLIVVPDDTRITRGLTMALGFILVDDEFDPDEARDLVAGLLATITPRVEVVEIVDTTDMPHFTA
jgi:hypothetical protein